MMVKWIRSASLKNLLSAKAGYAALMYPTKDGINGVPPENGEPTCILLIDLPSGDVMDGFEDWFAAEIKGWFGPTDFEDELSDTHASAKAGWFAARGGKP